MAKQSKRRARTTGADLSGIMDAQWHDGQFTDWRLSKRERALMRGAYLTGAALMCSITTAINGGKGKVTEAAAKSFWRRVEREVAKLRRKPVN